MNLSSFYQKARQNRKGRGLSAKKRRLGFDPLEQRLLLSFSQGIDAHLFSAVSAEFPGFGIESVAPDRVYVIEGSEISADSLREAVLAAEEAPGADMIVIRTSELSHTITFSSASDTFVIGDPSPLTIVAYGPEKLTVDADGWSEIFDIAAGSTVQLGNLVLKNGLADNGGAIRSAGRLTIAASIVSSNSASLQGGGIYSTGSLELVNCVVSGNSSQGHGGGICLTGTNRLNHRITNCTITGNRAGLDGRGRGGGIYFHGTDLESQTASHLVINNSIIVKNRSASTEIDENIYDSMFYFEIEFEDEIYVIEEGTAALIDGSSNLTTFIYWYSWYDPDSPVINTGSNLVYNEAYPLFVRDYNFDTNTEGDYSLQDFSLSQAIDLGDNAKAVYSDGSAIPYDISGSPRIYNDDVDIGAYEFVSRGTDLATYDGGTLSSTAVVSGGAVEISGIAVNNTDYKSSGAFSISFYASNDAVITAEDIFLGRKECSSIGGYLERTFNSSLISTSALSPGTDWYIGWIIDSPLDDNTGNNSGHCPYLLTVVSELSRPETVTFQNSGYSVQQGCAFYLTSAKIPAGNFDWWWDYGTGYYVEGRPGVWISPAEYPSSPGTYSIRLKLVDRTTQKVVQTGSAALTVSYVKPSICVEQSSLLNGQILKLDISVNNGGSNVRQWNLDWGDGSPAETLNCLSNSLTTAHCYNASINSKTYNITLSVIDTNGSGGDTAYLICRHTVGPNSAAAPKAAFLPFACGEEGRAEIFSDTETAEDASNLISDRLEPEKTLSGKTIFDGLTAADLQRKNYLRGKELSDSDLGRQDSRIKETHPSFSEGRESEFHNLLLSKVFSDHWDSFLIAEETVKRTDNGAVSIEVFLAGQDIFPW